MSRIMWRMLVATFILGLPRIAMASPGAAADENAVNSLANVLGRLSEDSLAGLVNLSSLGGCNLIG